MLVSRIADRFILYYNVTDDVYAMDPRGGTLFKRRRTALAVKTLLSPRIEVLACLSQYADGRRVPVLNRANSRRPTVRPVPPHLVSRSRRRGR